MSFLRSFTSRFKQKQIPHKSIRVLWTIIVLMLVFIVTIGSTWVVRAASMPTVTTTLLYSVGNRVWFDTDNSSTINGAEVGVDGVFVNLYDASDLTTILATQNTINGGYYLFNGLNAGDYVVSIAASNFNTGGVLKGYWSSAVSINTVGALTESTAATANSDTDSDDNGTLQSGVTLNGAVTSSVVTLGPDTFEPTDETDLDNGRQGQEDAQANMTVDFGFYAISLGDRVWDDLDNSGLLDGSELGIDDVNVELRAADGSALLRTVTTAGGGLYSFDDLPAGDYIVRLSSDNFNPGGVLRDYRSSTGQLPMLAYEPAPDADTNTANDDDNGSETNGLVGLGGYIQTLPVTLSPAAEASSNNVTGRTLESRVDFGVNKSPQLDLTVTKSDGQSSYLAGGILNYTIVVTNNGPADATGMTVSDAKPSQITSWAWTCAVGTPAGYNCSNAPSNSATFTDALDLPQLASVTYHVVAQVAPGATGNLTNTISVFPPSGMTDMTPRDNTATDTDTLMVPTPTPTRTPTRTPTSVPVTVSINQAASQIDPATSAPIHFTAIFSEAVSGFTGADISFSGTTLTGTLSATISQVNSTTYDVAVKGMIPKGTVFVSIPAGRVASISRPGVMNKASTSSDNNVIFDYVLVEFASSGVQDGWVLESTETSGQGGSRDNTSTTASVGDDASDRQYRSLLDFATGALPDNAMIYSINLRIVESGVRGSNPFATHGFLRSEIKSGFFGTFAALQNSDFESLQDKTACDFEAVPEMIQLIGIAYRCVVFPVAFPHINLTGSTQFRLRFTTDDNDNMSADTFNFYSGDFPNIYQRPRLFIKYYLPPAP